MTTVGPSADPPPPIDPADRPTDARLARLHLRTGMLGLARAELETMAGAGTLDDEALLDLAEVRWRTGDLIGAGEAAQAYLATGREASLGFVIAAEAAASLGRPGEAKRLATRALERLDVPLERIFAGIARSSIWPIDPSDPGEPAGALFPPEDEGARGGRPRRPAAASAAAAAAGADSNTSEAPLGAIAETGAPEGPGLWGPTGVGNAGEPVTPDPGLELEAARRAIAAGDLGSAAVRLALTLRHDPSLAAAVLAAAGTHDDPALDIVRGDAYRVIGRHVEARAAYAAAARELSADDRPTTPEPDAP